MPPIEKTIEDIFNIISEVVGFKITPETLLEGVKEVADEITKPGKSEYEFFELVGGYPICSKCRQYITRSPSSTGWGHINVSCGTTPTPALLKYAKSSTESSKETTDKGLTEFQRDKMAFVVHHRVQLEDSRKRVESSRKLLEDIRVSFEREKHRLEKNITADTENMLSHQKMMVAGEEALRKSILQEVLVTGNIPSELPSLPEPEPEIEIEAEQLGREG